MATPFREMSWPVQALAFLGLAIVLVLAGLYLPLSPVRTVRVAVDDANAQLEPLEKEVQTLRVYQQRRVELQGEMEALQKQLATLQAIVPENKEIDQFIIMVQGAASGAGVSIRKITTEPVVAKQYHYEMPVKLTADGPYFAVMDFFARLARLSRIINVGDVKLEEVKGGTGSSTFRMAPGTTVSGDFLITTYFTQPADEAAASAQASAAAVKH
ncbi:MAG TPA: type 4a pilus biogenesis protein PilO [Candidatus Acidoferrales bacterium]|nr:type 4a pilus biogenesis protein PilO [Candidatus Acidoferrales bacterium]HEV2297617.1 type 4a pilus biogenesis protein PilO [Candidatus Acidoferrales bacterium]